MQTRFRMLTQDYRLRDVAVIVIVRPFEHICADLYFCNVNVSRLAQR
jgi:hypothetical protein